MDTLTARRDGSDWLLGAGAFGRVYKGLRGGVQDIAIKQVSSPPNTLFNFTCKIVFHNIYSYEFSCMSSHACELLLINPRKSNPSPSSLVLISLWTWSYAELVMQRAIKE